MEQKKVSLTARSGLYVGESVADESPLEPGVFLIPRHATEQEPPAEVAAGFAAFWCKMAWC